VSGINKESSELTGVRSLFGELRYKTMGLKITLRPHEQIIVGGAVLRNGNKNSHFVIKNKVPVLREKDIMSEEEANSPCRRIYFVIQLMYIDEKNLREHHQLYWKLTWDVLASVPSTFPLIIQISEHILSNRYYQALRVTRKLIEYEQEVLRYVRSPGRGLPKSA
jgi:flagellar protein FlbT